MDPCIECDKGAVYYGKATELAATTTVWANALLVVAVAALVDLHRALGDEVANEVQAAKQVRNGRGAAAAKRSNNRRKQTTTMQTTL